MITSVGFIGLGAMGSGMVRNLLKGDVPVRCYDLNRQAVEAMEAAGATGAHSPGTAADGADLVITMLPNASDVDAVLDGPDGILAASTGDGLLMNCSTIDPFEAKRLAEKAAAGGWRYIDCAVGRTATQAAEGKCLFILGGDDADKTLVRPVLEHMGDTIVDGGDIGQASSLKIVNNYLALVSCLATAETLALAEAAGLSADTALQVINGTTARNGNTELNFPNKALKGDVSPGFPLMHGRKDLGIAVGAMERFKVPSFLGVRALDAFDTALDRGRGSNDCSDILNVLLALKQEGSGK